jgi:hypothetical protein
MVTEKGTGLSRNGYAEMLVHAEVTRCAQHVGWTYEQVVALHF